MEDSERVRKLVEFIFSKEFAKDEKMTATYSEMTATDSEMTTTDSSEEMTATDSEMTATDSEMTATDSSEEMTATDSATDSSEEMTTIDSSEEMTATDLSEEMTATNLSEEMTATDLSEEITATNASIPACLLTSDFSDSLAELFPQMLKNVLITKKVIFSDEWEKNITVCCDIMFSSHRMYLKLVILCCLCEAFYHESGCEIFISMCALLKCFNERIFTSTGMDFRDLNTDVIVLLYNDFLKHSFGKKVGYQKLLKYICRHRYLSFRVEDTVLTPADFFDALLKNRKIKEELDRRNTRITKEERETMEASTTLLSRKLLEETSVELPTLFNDPDLIKGLKGSRSAGKVKKK